MMDMDRRQFIRNAFLMAGGGWAGFKALYALGGDALIREAQAKNYILGGHVASGGGAGAYAGWDQSSKSTLDMDQDGDGNEDTHVMLLENVAAGGNETGVGYVTGADLVWTQQGNLAGASGGFRSFDGGDDKLAITQPLSNIVCGTDTYSCIIKLKDWVQVNEPALFFRNAAANDYFTIHRPGTPGPLSAHFIVAGSQKMGGATTNDLPGTGTYYVVNCCNGTNHLYGFTSSGSGAGGQPTKLSDFAANDRVITAFSAQMPVDSFDTHRELACETGSYFTDLDIAWVLLSRVCVIDFSS